MDDDGVDPVVVGPRAEPGVGLVAAIAAGYGLGAVGAARDLGGTYNLNLLIRTDAAAYVARVHRPWATPARLRFLQEAKRAVARAAFPVVEPLPTRDGRGMLRFGGRWLEVEPYVPHDGVADDWDRYAAAFAALGRLHGLLAQSCPAATFVAPAVSNYGEPRVVERWARQTRAALAGADARRADAVCREALELLAALRGWWEREGGQLPAQPIHGDFGGANVLFAGSRLVAVLDFDFLARRERVFELAYALYWMLRRLAGFAPEAYPWRRVGALLADYSAAAPRPLAAAEVRALPLEMARVPLYWVGEARFTDDPLQSVLDREADVRLARWLLDHRAEVGAELEAETATGARSRLPRRAPRRAQSGSAPRASGVNDRPAPVRRTPG